MYDVQMTFRDRADAGRRLAEKLTEYRGDKTVICAIPRGGVPVGIEVAKRLGAGLDIIVPRKITIPQNPEAGYGAVTEDGVVVLNEPLVKEIGISKRQIQRHAQEVRTEIERRLSLYRRYLPPADLKGRVAIIVDDGLASGFTMFAAVRSIEQRKASKVVIGVPVASGGAYDLVKPLVSEITALVVSRGFSFAVASFYRNWYDLSDDEVVRLFRTWAREREEILPRKQ